MFDWFWRQRPQPRPYPRADERFARELHSVHQHVDRQIFWGLIIQWAVVLVAAFAWSAWADWKGLPRVWSAILWNGALCGVPLWMIHRRPGSWVARLSVAVSQGLLSTLLVYATGGRAETHLHLFVWLAILALYCDASVLYAAGAAALVSQLALILGATLPESAMIDASRWSEHAVWLVGEAACLAAFVQVRLSAMFDLARREAALESLNNNLERKVERRTNSLIEEQQRLQQEIDSLREGRAEAEADELEAAYLLSELRHEVTSQVTSILATAKCTVNAPLPEIWKPRWQEVGDAAQRLLKLAQPGSIRANTNTKATQQVDHIDLKDVFTAVGTEVEARALLLVDDPIQRTLAEHALQQAGFQVDVVFNGPRAYYSAMLRGYELVMIDIDLPNEEGFDTVEAMRLLPDGIGSSLGIFAITAARTPDRLMRCAEIGVDGCLIKPVTHAALEQTLSGGTVQPQPDNEFQLDLAGAQFS